MKSSIVTEGGRSLSVMVRIPTPSFKTTFERLFNDTEIVSLSSSSASSIILIGMLCEITSGANVRVPVTGV